MNMKRLTQQVASAALLFVAALSPIAACAEEIYDSRPVIVRPAARGLRECPTCLKGTILAATASRMSGTVLMRSGPMSAVSDGIDAYILK
jgi:hypothetical protein